MVGSKNTRMNKKIIVSSLAQRTNDLSSKKNQVRPEWHTTETYEKALPYLGHTQVHTLPDSV